MENLSEYISTLDESGFADFFVKIHLSNPDGELYREREKKFGEIRDYAVHIFKILQKMSSKREIVLVDLACGKSYLSFFINCLNGMTLKRKLRIIGVDHNDELISSCNRIAEELKFSNMRFYSSPVLNMDWKEDIAPDITYALHACDTASDEVIAKAVQIKSKHIVVVPCCHRQMARQVIVPGLTERSTPKDRLATMITDSFRDLLLQHCGYKVDLFSFTPEKNTPKNIMIRAEFQGSPRSGALERYRKLKEFFNIRETPALEQYLNISC